MFDQLFTRSHARGRHLNSPLPKERLDYLHHCAGQSYKPSTLRELAQNLLRIQKLLRLATSSNAIAPVTIEVVVNRAFGSRISDARRKHIVSIAIHWLAFLKRLHLPPVASPVYQSLREDFVDYLRDQRGLSAQTLRTRCGSVQDFLQWFFRKHQSLRALTIADLDEAVARKGRDEGYTRRSIQRYASDLRTFIRYAESKRWCPQGLAAGIASPRIYRGENLSRGLSWNDVQRLIATTKGDRPLDVRDHAILLLLAVYGLRSIEVRNLKLDDVDWQRNLLFIARTKGRGTEPYPLSSTVGEAIARYLERIRHRSPHREIFLTAAAPIRPLGDGTVRRMVARRARSLNPPVAPHGAHALRHACATHLLEQGLSLKDISDHLGHRSLDTTTIYAPVNLTGLREVANLSLAGLL
jgi:integrase/recombinase XerD